MNAQSLSDREKQGLRGPVREYTQIDFFDHLQQDSSVDTSRQSQMKGSMVFDQMGRLTLRSHTNPDGSAWDMRFDYDERGLPVRTTSGSKEGPQTSVINEYDGSGRIVRTTSSASSTPIATYTYDKQGKKQKIQTSSASNYKERVAYGGSPFSATDHAPNLPGGGTTITSYDDLDRPCETEVRDETGEVISRAVRTFNAKGQVIEERQILPDPILILPRQSREQIQSQAGVTPDDLRAQLKTLMGDNPGISGEKYEYDAQGRVTKTYRQVFNRQELIETTHNENGDISSQITRLVKVGPGNPEGAAYSEAQYKYQYDEYGNWTEKIVMHRLASEEPFKMTSRTTRTLTYF